MSPVKPDATPFFCVLAPKSLNNKGLDLSGADHSTTVHHSQLKHIENPVQKLWSAIFSKYEGTPESEYREIRSIRAGFREFLSPQHNSCQAQNACLNEKTAPVKSGFSS